MPAGERRITVKKQVKNQHWSNINQAARRLEKVRNDTSQQTVNANVLLDWLIESQ